VSIKVTSGILELGSDRRLNYSALYSRCHCH